MTLIKVLRLAGLAYLGMFFMGCASVPMASESEDQAAKQFEVPAGKSSIYVYRNETFGGAVTMGVTLDGQMMGKSAPMTYFHWLVEPGKHEIVSTNDSKINLNAKAGKNHFIWQEVKMGFMMAGSKLVEVTENIGKKAVMECRLIKPVK